MYRELFYKYSCAEGGSVCMFLDFMYSRGETLICWMSLFVQTKTMWEGRFGVCVCGVRFLWNLFYVRIWKPYAAELACGRFGGGGCVI